MKIKSRLKVCFVLSIISIVLNGLTLFWDIADNESIVYIGFDIVYVVCAIISAILFAKFSFNNEEYLYKHKTLFVIAVCASAICSLILAIVAFFTYFEVFATRKRMIYKQDNTIETEGKVIPTAEEIAKKIKVLDDMLFSNSITQEEYDKLKQDILNELVK